MRDFSGLLARVRSGAEIVIDGREPVIVALAGPVRGRSVSECIALAKAHHGKTSEPPVLDADFAADLEKVIHDRKPWNPPAWE